MATNPTVSDYNRRNARRNAIKGVDGKPCDQAMGHHLNTTDSGRRRPRKSIRPELVMGMRQQPHQQRHHRCWGARLLG